MQGKGFISSFAIVLGLVCLYYLSQTFYAVSVENKAERLSAGDPTKYQKEIEKLSKDTLNLGIVKYNYKDAQSKEINLGLDLKGGINVTLQISVKDLLNELSNDSKNATYLKALELSDQDIKRSDKGYLEIFLNNFEKLKLANGGKPNLADFDIFGNKKNVDQININMTDEETKRVLTKNIEASINTAFEVFSTRIDRFGVAQPSIQRVPGTGRIIVELPGAKDVARIKKLLQTSARLEFWKVYDNQTARNYVLSIPTDTLKGGNLAQLLNLNNVANQTIKAGGTFGAAKISDTAKVNQLLKSPIAQAKKIGNFKFSKFLWAAQPDPENPEYLGIYCIDDVGHRDIPLLEDAVSNSSADYDNQNLSSRVVVNMQMNTEGALKWKDLTTKYVGQAIAIVLDNLVYSAPNINEPIPNGNSQISGNFSIEEAKDLSDALQSGKLPASAEIIQSDVVGPSLGKDSINAGLISFAIAFICILVYMVFYYGQAGANADIVLVINIFYILGIFAAFKFVLTLPGIAGLVLTLGMAVDANIITFERVKEELKMGKGLKEAYREGWNHALSAIIDGNVTTLLTAAVLFVVGTGPIKGFATTLGIGIISTLFTALLVSRVLIENRLAKGKSISFWTSITKNWFDNVHFNWMGKRKYAYAFSIIATIIAIISLSINGLNYGVDFSGGRTYTIQFDKPVDAVKIGEDLANAFPKENGLKVKFDTKTFGTDNQVKITTKYKYNDDVPGTDTEIENLLFKNLKQYLPANYTEKDFSSGDGYGIRSYSKVGPTIADDIQRKGVYAILISLLGIFLYILFRFRKWQFSLGAVIALFHDALFVIGLFSLLYKVMPFSLEIDQSFIAAILTVIGYSINDSVIVFDRIRENLKLHPTTTLFQNVNNSINQTLGRTFNTSATTFFVILIIFIFGGENLRGFMFAMLAGIGIGTYSSVYIASALMYDLLRKSNKEEAKKA